MKYYIIAGEASGDLHGSRLINAIFKNDPEATIRAWGGDKMEEAGATIIKHYRDLAFMGFTEVVSNISTILSNMKFCKNDICTFNPDVVVFIDYPGFNLPIAKFVKSKGYKTVYYISPQIWAWKEKRIHTIKKVVDKMMVILPFEKTFYEKWKYPVDYVGHPLIEIIDHYKLSLNKEEVILSLGIPTGKKIIALLPGSRKQEIAKKLPIMLESSNDFPEALFVVAQAPGISDDFITAYTNKYTNVKLIKNKTYDLLSIADAALVTSGTATLETALFRVPEIVCYKGSPISYAIAKKLIKVKYISLVNLIMDQPIVKELIQHELTAENIKQELKELLYNEDRKNKYKADTDKLYQLLSAGGKASEKAAGIIHQMLIA
jgi:lipid-A-disaccharide synthase